MGSFRTQTCGDPKRLLKEMKLRGVKQPSHGIRIWVFVSLSLIFQKQYPSQEGLQYKLPGGPRTRKGVQTVRANLLGDGALHQQYRYLTKRRKFQNFYP